MTVIAMIVITVVASAVAGFVAAEVLYKRKANTKTSHTSSLLTQIPVKE